MWRGKADQVTAMKSNEMKSFPPMQWLAESRAPSFAMPTFRLLELDELFPLAASVLLLAYVEGVSTARRFAAKHG